MAEREQLRASNEAYHRRNLLNRAAPELLAALEAIAGEGKPGSPSLLAYYHCVEECELPSNCMHCKVVKGAREALAKARGEESVRGCSCGMADYGAPGHEGHHGSS